MAVTLPCPLCKKMQSPTLNPKNHDVYCELCGEKITVGHFVLAQLKALKQYAEPKKTPFAVKCPKCGKEEKPRDTGAEIVCGACDEPLEHLTDTFKRMLRTVLGKVDKDV